MKHPTTTEPAPPARSVRSDKRTGPVISHRLRTFIIVSIVAHLLFAIGWGIPEYLRRAEARQQALVEELAGQLERERMEQAKAEAEQAAIDAIKEQIIEDLRRDFEQLVQDDLNPQLSGSLWDDILAAIFADLEQYAQVLADASATDAEVMEQMAAVQGSMLDELLRRLRAMTARQLADSFVETVETTVVPRVAEHYQQQVQTAIGRPLQQAGSTIIRDENRTVTQDRAAVQRDLVAAQRQAEAAERDLRQAAQRIENASRNVGRPNQPDEAAIVNREQAAVDRAAAALTTAEARLRAAAEQSSTFGEEVASRITATADEQAKTAQDAVAETAKQLPEGKADETVKSAREAADEAARLAAATAEVRAMAEGAADFNAIAQARAVVKEVRDQEIRSDLDDSFREKYHANAAPRLTERLTGSFETTLALAGIEDEQIVKEVESKVRELLGEPVVGRVDAADAGTAQLTRTESLDGASSEDMKHEGRAQEVAERVREAASELTGAGMEALTRNAGSDAALADVPGGDGSDALGGQTSVLERVAAVGAGLQGGRTSFLEGAAGSAMNAARMRQRSLERMQNAQRLIRNEYYYNRLEHERLTAGIHQRDRAAAQGQGIERTGADGAATVGEVAADMARPSVLLMPSAIASSDAAEPAAPEPFEPAFESIRFMTIPFLEKPPTLDGDLSDWEAIPAHPLRAMHGEAPPQHMKVGWNNSGLYFAVEVKDPDNQIQHVNAENFWEGDAIEIFIDSLNTKDLRRGSEWSQQFWVWPFGQAGDPTKIGGEAVKRAPEGAFTSVVYTNEQIHTASRKTDDGWALEVHLPAERLRRSNLQPGRIIGMNLSICTGTPVYFYWAGTAEVRTSERPDTWGDVLLAGTAGRIEIPEKIASEMNEGESAEPARALVIGEPLRIRVSDADMSLSSRARDKLPVTVTTRHGDTEIVILEETTETSGVFEGSIRTELAFGEAIPGTLSLYDGETVTILYIDQAGPEGVRNTEVKATIQTAAGVTSVASQ